MESPLTRSPHPPRVPSVPLRSTASLPRRVAFALLGALGFAGLLELSARLAEPGLTPPDRSLPLPRPGSEPKFLKQAQKVRDQLGGLPMIQDDASGWGLPPDRIVMSGSVPCRINSLGLRGPELGPRAEGESRLLSLGDSTIFGDGVPESQVFSSVAAARLTDVWGRPVQGVIGGVPGHDSSQSLARLREKGAAAAPTWVIIGNLWSDVYKDHGFTRPPSAVEELRGPLRHLATYRLLRHLLAPWLLHRKVGWIASMKDDVGGQAPVGASGASANTQDRARVLLRDYIENLRAMAQETKRIGARPAFLALPAPIDLDPAGPPADILEYREAMRTVAEESGAPYIDGPGWLHDHQGTIGHFADQVHPTPLGHQLIGEAVAAAVGPHGP